ncbi:unnamed protein product [Calypogeia fissa]
MGTFPVITVSRALLVLYVAAGVFQTVESTSIRAKLFGGHSIIQETLASYPNHQNRTRLRPHQSRPNVSSPTPCEESEALSGSQPKFVSFSGLCHYDHSKDPKGTFCDICWAEIDPATTTYTPVNRAKTIWGAAAQHKRDPTLYCDIYFYTY